jgi:hypothetical protein
MAQKYYWLQFKNADGEWEVENGYPIRRDAQDDKEVLIGSYAPWTPRGWLRNKDVRIVVENVPDEDWEAYVEGQSTKPGPRAQAGMYALKKSEREQAERDQAQRDKIEAKNKKEIEAIEKEFVKGGKIDRARFGLGTIRRKEK